MRNTDKKNKLKHHLTPPPFPRLNFIPDPLPLPVRRDGEWGVGVVHSIPLCHSVLMLLACCSVSPSRQLHSFTNCPSMNPLCGLKFWKNLLQHCPSQAAAYFRAHLRAPAGGGYLLYCGPPWAGRKYLLHHDLSMNCKGISAFMPRAPPPSPSSVTLRCV